jgi:uncharacterized protein
MVTNGYLLDREKIAHLNKLKISFLQITLDGPEEVHDTRRVLPGGGPTFRRILDNVAALMDSSYEGVCAIRVNVDKRNLDSYIELRTALLERFKGKKLSVHPGQVHTSLGHAYDHANCLAAREWADFNIDLYRQGDVLPPGGWFPSDTGGCCVATTHHAFVVGPEGELYKCWEDVGKPAMVIGSIHEPEPIVNSERLSQCFAPFWTQERVQESFVTHPELRAQYSVGTDPYNDPVCRTCDVLPICGGGCVNKRLRTKHFGEEGLEFCSIYRDSLIPCLEAYIEGFQTEEICAAVLNEDDEKQGNRGYRVVSPEKRRSAK